MHAARKWIPAYTREFAALSAACDRLVNVRVIGGGGRCGWPAGDVVAVKVKPMSSVPK